MLKKLTKVLSLLLILCMMVSMFPVVALADEGAVEPVVTETPEETTPVVTPVPVESPVPSETPTVEESPAPSETPADSTPVEDVPAADGSADFALPKDNAADEPDADDGSEPQADEEDATFNITRAGNVPLDTSKFYRIFHLDCGRKYFSVDQIKALIDTLAANNYTHIELAIGNDGLRFLLDDMSVAANDTTYASDAVKAGIQAGNTAYYNDPNGNALTQTEMGTIISYANEKGIGIIPLLNSPGHMDAILDCMESVGISNPAYSNSARTVDVTNTAAVNFTLALVNKYIQYFAGKGCTIFNMGCDEYANDVSNSGFAGLISSGKYGDFITYVNNMAAQVQNAGMTPMAFNDGIYYNSNTSSGTFDSNISIAYWTTGWPGYSPASALFLAQQGHTIISTNDAWYYVLGRQAGNSSGYTIATAQNGVQNTACTDIPGGNGLTAAGCMICLWCDTPSASYSSTEVSNVTGLLTTFATNNPTYFAADSGETGGGSGNTGDVEVTENKTITVAVGQTVTDTISGYNFAGTYTTEDSSIATVEVTGTDATEATTTYTQASVTCSTLISRNSNNWTAVSGYYYKADDGNYYPLYAKRSSSWRNYTYTWGYSKTDLSSDVTQIGTQSTYYPSYTDPNITVYTESTTAGSPAFTTVTFTGVAVGTTYVTVGNTRYTINVVAEDLSTVTPLTVEYWITNLQVTAGGATSKAISAQSAYGEAGVDVSTLVPATGTYAYGSVVYWKGTVLDSSNKQTTASGAENDKTGSGKDFNLLRYYNGSWQYFYEADGTWNTISSTDQVVIYWLQPTEVTKEITTLVKDWGYAPSDQRGDNNDKVALTVAVVYPDGTVSPAEGDMYSTSTTLFNYWDNRNIGLVAPVNNSDYVIAKITVTNGTRDQSGTGQWGANDTITWEKVTNEAGQQWYNETTYWDETVGGTPMVNGVTSNITWSTYNTAKLVLIYLKPVHYDTNLTVKWVNDSASGALISTMEVAVSSDGTPITFYNGLKQTSALPTEGVGGTFTLDDDAYVTNSSNVNQTFNKNISTVPDVADVYKTGLYQYVSADLSADGMTLTLHYNIDSSKLSKQYVVDFGLPVNVPLSDLIENSGSVTKVEITGGDATVNNDNSITYQPAAMLTGTATVGVKLTFNDNTTQTVRIGFVPATTVYYEEGFATLTGFTGGSKGTGTQAKQVAGSSSDEYGYDTSYNAVQPSNNSQATSSTKNDKAEFTFTGTGVDIYANSTTSTGWLLIQVKNSADSTVKVLQVNTALQNGTSGATTGQEVTGYNVPVASITGLTNGSYTVTITHIDDVTVNLDGFRVYGTLATEPAFYTTDKEDNPTFIELRDQVLAGLSVTSTGSNQNNAALPTDTTVVVVASSEEYTQANVNDLLKNGPKNEIYLQPNQALVLKITTAREVQIGLKALNAATTYTITGKDVAQTLNTSTDMFYTVQNKGTSGEQTITITNKGEGILSITKLKVCDDPGAALGELTEEDLIPALVSLGYELEPEEPEIQYADAVLTVEVNGQTATLTKNGVVGESATFTAAEIEAAAQNLVPDGYELKDQAADVTVAYGESSTVSLSAEAIPTEPEQPEEPEKPAEPQQPEQPGKPANIISAVIRLIDRIFGSLKGFFR